MRQVFVTFIFIALVFTACKKKDAAEPDLAPSPSKFSDKCTAPAKPITNPKMLLCKFKEGSYWVFKDSLSGNTDTLLLEKAHKGSGFMPPRFPIGCDSEEVYSMLMVMKHDNDELKSMFYLVYQGGMLMQSAYAYEGMPPAFFGGDALYTDSVFIYDRYYRSVSISKPIEFTTVPRANNPTRMYGLNMKSYFNAEFGPLQFDLRDRITGELKARRKVISRNISR